MPLDEFAQARREHDLTNAIATIRDLLKPIDEGEIERDNVKPGERARIVYVSAHSIQYTKGKRKTTLKDARRIAHHAIIAIDRALQKFEQEEHGEG